MRDKSEMEGHDATIKQAREVSDFLHLFCALGAGGERYETYRLGHGRNVRVTLPFESAKHGGQLDIQLLQTGREFLSVRFGSRLLSRCMELNRRHAEFMSDFQLHTQTGINAGEDTNGPLFHDSYSSFERTGGRVGRPEPGRAGRRSGP